MKYFKALTALIIFVLLCLVVYFVHITYFTVDVVFYAALFDAVIAVIVAAALLFLPYYSLLNGFEKLSIMIIFILVGYALSISIPTVIDRSLSFYILEKLEQRGGIQLASFEDVFTKEYAKEHRLVDVRLTEQLVSGTIIIQDGCVKLTERGKRLASFSRYFRRNFLPKKRLLMGEYSDDLTDPFRENNSVNSYVCN